MLDNMSVSPVPTYITTVSLTVPPSCPEAYYADTYADVSTKIPDNLCEIDNECNFGYICKNGICVLPPPTCPEIMLISGTEEPENALTRNPIYKDAGVFPSRKETLVNVSGIPLETPAATVLSTQYPTYVPVESSSTLPPLVDYIELTEAPTCRPQFYKSGLFMHGRTSI